MNSDIDAISGWAYNHALRLNEGKTQSIIVTHNRFRAQNVPRLRLNGIELEYSESVKNLGLVISKTLSWLNQVEIVCKMVFACIHSLKRFALFLPLNIKIMLVKTLVLPHFSYCDTVMNDMTVELSNRLQRTQNYCIRFIFNARRFDHVTPFYVQPSLLKLNDLRTLHILTMLHSIIKTKSPSYLSESFRFLSEIGERATRHGNLLLAFPIHRTTTFERSFTVTGCRLWNNLPASVRAIDGRARFGVEVKRILLASLRG
ncbi:uncharacterized protein LOC120351066 [Nilaparvata lugens]|uniref:uncharacterized protein LOC120351066 n=1 Tax=Nilaparvata lugens TaxID=108931 RepID=UPI00193D92EF|nr:uncharacterized protein LOC120351066 [Nilaparvata lugens]